MTTEEINALKLELINEVHVTEEQACKAATILELDEGTPYRMMHELNEALNCFGVEEIRHPFTDECIAHCLNVGEAYQATLVFVHSGVIDGDFPTGFQVSSWGGIIETAEKNASQLVLDQDYKLIRANGGGPVFATNNPDDPTACLGPFEDCTEAFKFIYTDILC
jgi:hypothetical protein